MIFPSALRAETGFSSWMSMPQDLRSFGTSCPASPHLPGSPHLILDPRSKVMDIPDAQVWEMPGVQEMITPLSRILLHACSVTKSCLTLCNPMDCSPSGSSVHGISQERMLSGMPFPSSGDLTDLGIKPAFPALASEFFTTKPPGKLHESSGFPKYPALIWKLGPGRWRQGALDCGL